MLIIVDRFEGDYVVLLEENQTRDVPMTAGFARNTGSAPAVCCWR